MNNIKIKLQRVHFIPKELESGILYVSEEFGIALHLCACGCGARIRTPLGPTGWSIEDTTDGPTLDPSVGNWQQPCMSHYWISQGEIVWAKKWTNKQIIAGRIFEETHRNAYYDSLGRQREGILQRLWYGFKSLFKH